MNIKDTYQPQKVMIDVLTEGQFVWYTRDELKKLCGIGQGITNETISDLLRLNIIVSKGGNGQSNPRKYALSSRINGQVINGSKVVSNKPLIGYEKWLRARMDLCNSTRRD
jgi:hypothetical protein